MKTKSLLFALVATICLAVPRVAQAFCGFYVAGADTKLYNNATMVTLLRDGTTTVLSMGNNYQGPPEDFAMVIPVPVVLQKKDVKTLPHDIFDRLDKLAAPRLVEYWEQDPCPQTVPGGIGMGRYGVIGHGSGSGAGYGTRGGTLGVVVEAKFAVAEYEIVILSAKDALGLEAWITENGYKIPEGAAPFLAPYVEQGSKFFVAKVDPTKVTFKDGMAKLSPLRFHYTEKDFRLPVRLGLINAKEKQDLIVHILAKNQRYEVANYNNVTIPTNLIVNDDVRNRFGEFYAALFDATTEKNPNAVVTEYSWNANSCDPCPEPALRMDELLSLGLDVTDGRPAVEKPALQPQSTRMIPQVRIGTTVAGPGLDKNIIRRYIRRKLPRVRFCYEKELLKKPNLKGSAIVKFNITPSGDVQRSRASGLRNKNVESCIANTAATIKFPKPKGGAKVSVNVPLTFQSVASSASRGFGFASAPGGWVLTRLHARYDRSSLGEDLVFQEAKAIAGGQGGASDKLSKTASEASGNTFQGRYIIRHEWEGPMECESPQRGIWGGPPAGVERDTSPQAATDLAFAPRGGVSLTSMVSEPISALGLAPTANTPENTVEEVAPPQEEPVNTPSQAPEASDSKKGCSSSGGGSSWMALLFVALLLRRQRSGVAALRPTK